jgi:hypothetical protein
VCLPYILIALATVFLKAQIQKNSIASTNTKLVILVIWSYYCSSGAKVYLIRKMCDIFNGRQQMMQLLPYPRELSSDGINGFVYH